MKQPIVCDSTGLIALERIQRLEILSALFDPVVIPPRVRTEFGVDVPWIRVEAPRDETLVAAIELTVDRGEAEVIALTKERNWLALLDDRPARQVAARLGVSMVGTIAVLLRAKKERLISALGPLLDDLEKNSFFMSEDLKTEAIRLAGEESFRNP